MVSLSPYQVLQLEQVQDQATELSVNIMKVRSVGSSQTGLFGSHLTK